MKTIDFSNFPCGEDGLSFPQGLPKDNTEVEVLTVWSKGKWETKIYKEKYSYFRQYSWFGVYREPDIKNNSLPIVLDWRYK